MGKTKNSEKNKVKPYSFKEPEVRQFKELDLYGSYSYAQYLRWKFEDRVELIKGKIFKMAAPRLNHQRLLIGLGAALYNHLTGNPCEVFVAPCDVRLPTKSNKDEDIITVVQPDIFVVCDESKKDARGCLGAPDMIMEILSPTNRKRDLVVKYKLYEEFGVKEYWIVDTYKLRFTKYLINVNGVYGDPQHYSALDTIESEVVKGFRLNVDKAFERLN